MIKLTVFLSAFAVIAGLLTNPVLAAASAKIKVIILDDRARLCSYPSCGTGEEHLRVPTGEVLSVMDTKSVETGGTMKWIVVWYEVSYGGKKGWLSQHDVQPEAQ